MTRPLRHPKILSGAPRPVDRSGTYWTHKALTPREKSDLETLLLLIEAGGEIPGDFYSATAGHPESDPLLRDYGVMHLHLGGRGSDTVLFLMQFADHVVFLETNTHQRFRRQCAGLIAQHKLLPVPEPRVVVAAGRKPRNWKKHKA